MLSRLVSGGVLGALVGAAMSRAAPLPPSRCRRLRSNAPSRPPASNKSIIIIGATTAALITTTPTIGRIITLTIIILTITTLTIDRIIILITTTTTIDRIITVTTIDLSRGGRRAKPRAIATRALDEDRARGSFGGRGARGAAFRGRGARLFPTSLSPERSARARGAIARKPSPANPRSI
jgi:hypothetical protein